MKAYDLKAFNEQTNFLKMLSQKLEIPNVNLHNDDYFRCFAIYYTQRSFDEESMNFLNEELREYILIGQLDNWLKVNKKHIKELPDIHFFWDDYCDCAEYFNLKVPTDFTDEELERLNDYKTHEELSKFGLADNSEEEPDVDFLEDPLDPMKLLHMKHEYEDAKIQEYIIKNNLKEEDTWLSELKRQFRGADPHTW